MLNTVYKIFIVFCTVVWCQP